MSQVGKKAQAHLVGPVDVLQDEYERLPASQVLDELGDGLEEPELVLGYRVERDRRLVQFGEESGQLRPPDRAQSSEPIAVENDARRPKGVDRRAEREQLLGLVAPAEKGMSASRPSPDRKCLDEPGLPHARLPQNRHDARPSTPRVIDQTLQSVELRGPAEEWCVGGGASFEERGVAAAACDLADGAIGRSTEALPGGPPRRVVWSQAPAQRSVPAARGRRRYGIAEAPHPGPGPDVQTHQGPTHRLLQRVERQQSDSGVNRAVVVRIVPLMREERREGTPRELPEALAFSEEPLLERRLRHAEALEEVAR